MTTSVVGVALNEIGVTEFPKNSNRTKYGEWAKYQGVPWCGLFCSYVYEKAGKPLPKIGFAFNGFAGCQTAVAYFKKNKMITTAPTEGDIVFFDWNKDGRYDHTGIFVKWIDANTFETIEGNTAVGNDSNGGTVMKRIRNKNVSIFVKVI